MRTTLDIGDDVLFAAKEMARREHLSAGQIISLLARLAMTARMSQTTPVATTAGFRPLPGRGVLVGND
jgi:hypothetical protein